VKATAERFAFPSSAVAVAIGLVLLAWLPQARYGWGNWDEGYLWYGVREVLKGAVPIRDFLSYDPGRYYWSAALSWAIGDDGLLATKAAAALFQLVGLSAGLVVLWRASADPWVRGLGAFALCAWMWPWFRVYDCAAAMLLIAAAAALVADPAPRRAFVAGLLLGALAIVGRNHGAYGAVGTGAALLLGLHARGDRALALRAIPAWSAGIALGYAPMAVALVVDAGLRHAFLVDILEMVRAGATNITLPVPWPHRAFASGGGFEAWRKFGLGLFFVALPAFILAGGWRLWRLGREERIAHAGFAACVLLALPYAHFAFSRADLSHMANGVAPMLLGVLAWPRVAPTALRVAAVALALATALVVVPRHPLPDALAQGGWVERVVGHDVMHMPPIQAADLDNRRRQVPAAGPGADRDVLIAPYGAGMYAALDRRSPTWEVYALQQRTPAFEEAEIARMQAAGVRLALVQDYALDGRDDLRYRNTHPRIQQWLDREFEAVERDRDTTVYRRRAP